MGGSSCKGEVSCECPVQYSHGQGADIDGAIPIPKENSAERTMSVRPHQSVLLTV